MKHYFNVEVAKDLGINAAVVFENLAFWIKRNAEAGRNLKDGAFWMYATQKDIAAQFDHLSPKQTRTAIERLVSAGYVETGRHNRHGYDRISWYRLTEKGESVCLPGRKAKPARAVSFARKGEPIPDIKPDIKPDLETRIAELKVRIGS